MKNIEYRTAPDLSGYLIGDDGSVLTLRKTGTSKKLRDTPKPMVPQKRGRYLSVLLTDDYGNRSHYFIHRLVLIAFVGPCPAGHECCHNNGDPKDNRLENLRWGTHQENVLDTKKHGTYPVGEKNPRRILSEAQVIEIRNRLNRGERVCDLAREYGVVGVAISRIKHRKAWKHLEEPTAA